ncbi:hypothetical protein NA57DRAFT_54269 [Rhizodiscina lignyota]|uniref:Uncharacterized protein n=1 Tax=Rhizodiscina lignyota TaxID=1504668 RepID=A0A9P4IJ21_9PEZI|nr:hypothetical protein NA57DRAFT_54269 [Rhizodiscina lignyota]
MTNNKQLSPSMLNDDAYPLKPNSTDCRGHTNLEDPGGGVKSFGKRTKSKFKRALRIDETKDRLKDSRDGVMSKLKNDAGFDLPNSLHVESSTIAQIKGHLPDSAHELAHVIRHPREVATEKTSQTLATSKEPYLSRDDDELLIDAHEKLQHAEEVHEVNPEHEEHINELKATVDDIEEGRESKRAAWTSSRYIQRARVIGPGRFKFPVLSSCRWVDLHGQPQGCRWSQWSDHMQLFVHHLWTEPFLDDHEDAPIWSRGLLLQQIERVVRASNPWQEWLSHIRQLWNWNDTRTTAAWFAVWLAVWYCNRVLTVAHCYVGYYIIYHKRGPGRRAALQQSHDRAGDEDATTHTLGEMISRHGSANWLDPMLEAVGPVIQPHLTNLADWMEVFENFYEWKAPRNTAALLLFLAISIVFATFSSTEFCVRVAELLVILLFFLDRPLANRYPKYAQVLMPFQWIFWDIPSHSETSFRHMRAHAEVIREAACEQTSDSPENSWASASDHDTNGRILSSPISSEERKDSVTDSAEAPCSDVFATRCRWRKNAGNIVLSCDDIRFVRSFPKKEMWRRPLRELAEIVKGNGETSIIKDTQDHLELTFADGNTEELEGLKKKDELFNIIIAFSGLTWQHA